MIKINSVYHKTIYFTGSVNKFSNRCPVGGDVPDLDRQRLAGSLANKNVLAISVVIDLRDAERGGGVILLGDALADDDADDLVDLLVEGLEGSEGGFLCGWGADVHSCEIRFHLDLRISWYFDSIQIAAALGKGDSE